jgi:hypothetical protein
MIDFVSENEYCTPLDYANATGAILCAEILQVFGAVTSETLLSNVATEIGRIWRGYRVRRLKFFTRATSQTKVLIGKDELSIPRFFISNSTSDMKPMSRESTKDSGPNGMREHLFTQGFDFTPANYQRRGSAVSFSQYPRAANRASSIPGQYYRMEPSASAKSLPATDMDVKDAAARRIQRAWRYRQRRIEAKFLILMMGPEEASKILEKNFSRQSSVAGTQSSSLLTPQTAGSVSTSSSVLLSRDSVLPTSRANQSRRGSISTMLGRSNLRLNLPNRPIHVSSRRGSFVDAALLGGPGQQHGPGPLQTPSSPTIEIEFMSLKAGPQSFTTQSKASEALAFMSNNETRERKHSRKHRQRRGSIGVEEDLIETPEREASVTRHGLIKKPTVKTGSSVVPIGGRHVDSLTADEIDYFRDVTQEYRSGGDIKDILSQTDRVKGLKKKSTFSKMSVIEAGDDDDQGAAFAPKGSLSISGQALGNTFSSDEMSYFAMMAEEKQREG